jgi:hypothetical protein
LPQARAMRRQKPRKLLKIHVKIGSISHEFPPLSAYIAIRINNGSRAIAHG